MSFRWPLVLLLSVTALPALKAQVHVTITPPELVEIGAALTQDLVSQQEVSTLVAGPLGQYEALAAGQIEKALGKPGLYAGLADAVTLPLLGLLSTPGPTRFSAALSWDLGLQTDTLLAAVVLDRFQRLRPEDDYQFGAAAQPAALVLGWTPQQGLWSWSFAWEGAWFQGGTTTRLQTSSVGAAAAWRYRPLARWGALVWEGWSVGAGGGWAHNALEVPVSFSLPRLVVPLTLTYWSNAGNVVLTTDPHITVRAEAQGVTTPVFVSTGLNWGQTLSLEVAVGGAPSWGRSQLSMTGRNVVHLASETADPTLQIYEKFLGPTAWVQVDGGVGRSFEVQWQPWAVATLSWSVGAFRFSAPLTYRHPGGVGVGLRWGADL